MAVMRSWSDGGRTTVPTERTLTKRWQTWRGLAPLWAASISLVRSLQTSGFSADAAIWEALHDPARLRRLLGHAKWFRSFAVGFIPEHSATALIPQGEAVEIVASAPEVMPDLEELPPADLAAAAGYRAPTRKFYP
jgi:hypothetical protein